MHLQKLFIQERDRVCDERLESVALSFTLNKLENELNEEKVAYEEANENSEEAVIYISSCLISLNEAILKPRINHRTRNLK